MAKKIIVANWKMNPRTESAALKLLRAEAKLKSKRARIIICPPYSFLELSGRLKNRPVLGAQDVFWAEKGAHTGEISVSMLRSLGVSYVIIGHSERRALGETDKEINKKIKIALDAGLNVILCVGESRAVHLRGKGAVEKFVGSELAKDMTGQDASKMKSKLIVAYEPIWAIGTGKADAPEDSARMAGYIKRLVREKFKIQNVPVLYGGSVNSGNIVSFLSQSGIDGALVGGASLKTGEFGKIIKNI